MTAEARGDVGPVWHEAFTLPLVFLSAALLGGLRIDAGGGLAFVRPPLFALVLAVMLIAALYRSGAFDPARLFHPRRTGLAKASGAVIVVALTAAGFASFYLGLVVALPLVGHATWHAYRDVVA